MNIHPIIDEPPSFPQTVLRLLTGSTHCCDWCEKRWIKVHRMVFTDGGFLRREEYDGREWWEYEPPFRVPETQKPFKLVKGLSYYTQLLVDINYPMKATEE